MSCVHVHLLSRDHKVWTASLNWPLSAFLRVWKGPFEGFWHCGWGPRQIPHLVPGCRAWSPGSVWRGQNGGLALTSNQVLGLDLGCEGRAGAKYVGGSLGKSWEPTSGLLSVGWTMREGPGQSTGRWAGESVISTPRPPQGRFRGRWPACEHSLGQCLLGVCMGTGLRAL